MSKCDIGVIDVFSGPRVTETGFGAYGRMENIREKIKSELAKLDMYKYVNMDYRQYDKNIVEEQVIEELQFHCKGQQYSECLKNQLINLYGNGFVEICELKHPYETDDIYCAIDAVIKDPTISMPFYKKKSCLYGRNIFHIHHSQSFYSVYNSRRYFEKKYRCDDDVWRRLKELSSELSTKTNLIPQMVNEVFLESLAMPEKTGEWLVFSKDGDKLKFLCLYIHRSPSPNDKELYSLIKEEFWDNLPDLP